MKNKRVCVATSGGMDSTALLHYLKSREKEYCFTLSAVHCEHGIRGKESVEDMRFVQELCNAWDIPLYVFRENCIEKAEREKTSLETAARNFRYACFDSLLKDEQADYIATAHHLQDEAETVLFRIARGASLTGASGMYAQRTGFIRPFLDWSKEKICAYVKENNLSYRTDKSNEETEFTRNKLRHTVFPALEEAVSGATENIARFAIRAAEDDAFLYRQSEKLLSYNGKMRTVAFSQEKPLFTRACLMAMKSLGLDKDYTQTHLDGVFRLQESERGAYLTLPKGIVAEKQEKGIVFYVFEDEKEVVLSASVPFSSEGFDGGMYAVKISVQEPKMQGYVGKILRIDGEKLPQNATFRFRKEGDSLEKFGGGTKSLKKYLNEKKVPVKTRTRLPLIADEKGSEVYVVCGYEIAEKVKVTEDTKQTLYITLWEK